MEHHKSHHHLSCSNICKFGYQPGWWSLTPRRNNFKWIYAVLHIFLLYPIQICKCPHLIWTELKCFLGLKQLLLDCLLCIILLIFFSLVSTNPTTVLECIAERWSTQRHLVFKVKSFPTFSTVQTVPNSFSPSFLCDLIWAIWKKTQVSLFFSF